MLGESACLQMFFLDIFKGFLNTCCSCCRCQARTCYLFARWSCAMLDVCSFWARYVACIFLGCGPAIRITARMGLATVVIWYWTSTWKFSWTVNCPLSKEELKAAEAAAEAGDHRWPVGEVWLYTSSCGQGNNTHVAAAQHMTWSLRPCLPEYFESSNDARPFTSTEGPLESISETIEIAILRLGQVWKRQLKYVWF